MRLSLARVMELKISSLLFSQRIGEGTIFTDRRSEIIPRPGLQIADLISWNIDGEKSAARSQPGGLGGRYCSSTRTSEW